MFIELTIIYPFKKSREKIINLLKSQKNNLLDSNKCLEYLINEDTYSDKIICIIKWSSKDTMKTSIGNKEHRKNLEAMVSLQKFPSEVFHLNEIKES